MFKKGFNFFCFRAKTFFFPAAGVVVELAPACNRLRGNVGWNRAREGKMLNSRFFSFFFFFTLMIGIRT
jgi:hypothetical protein